MLAIDVRDCHLTVVTPHRDGGVVSILVALGDARIEVSRIESRGDETGMYRLTVSDSPELAVRILEGIGCQVTRAPSDRIGIHHTARAGDYPTIDQSSKLVPIQARRGLLSRHVLPTIEPTGVDQLQVTKAMVPQ